MTSQSFNDEIIAVEKILTEMPEVYSPENIMLIAYLVRDSKFNVIQELYGKDFCNEFYKRYYPENSFI